MQYIEEGLADNAAVSVLAATLGFIERDSGRSTLKDFLYNYPELYWISAVKPFCYATAPYDDKTKNYLYSKAKVNLAIADLVDLPVAFNCRDKAPMRNRKCSGWVRPGG